MLVQFSPSPTRTMPTLGDQQSRPRCGSSVGGWFSPFPCNQSDRSSLPMTEPIARHAERLKVAPRKFGPGNEVGQRSLPSVPVPQRDWTPWIQFAPQSYSGTPSRGTLPAGDSRATRSNGFSSSVSREMRSSMRESMSREALQKGKLEVLGVEHARGMLAPTAYCMANAAPTAKARGRRIVVYSLNVSKSEEGDREFFAT